jgi:hypothetical protein
MRDLVPQRFRKAVSEAVAAPTTGVSATIVIPVQGTMARLKFAFVDAAGEPLKTSASSIEIRAMAGGAQLAQWRWLEKKRPIMGEQRVALRRGTARWPYQVIGESVPDVPADRLEVTGTLPDGVVGSLQIADAGWARY